MDPAASCGIPRQQAGAPLFYGGDEEMISARVQLTQPFKTDRQFVATTGTNHHLLIDDSAGGTGPKPIELIAVGLAGCTAFDVITILRQKYHQKVTAYEVRVEADQTERPPQVFSAVRIHHAITGHAIDPAAVETAIHLSEEKYCSVGAMIKQTAAIDTSYEIIEEQTALPEPTLASAH
jgi:putative redox protein